MARQLAQLCKNPLDLVEFQLCRTISKLIRSDATISSQRSLVFKSIHPLSRRSKTAAGFRSEWNARHLWSFLLDLPFDRIDRAPRKDTVKPGGECWVDLAQPVVDLFG